MSSPISRIAGLVGALLVGACGQAPTDEPVGNRAAPPQSAIQVVKDWVKGVKDERARIFCSVGEGASLAEDCRIETVEDARSRVLILSLPDGGFRRLRVGADGTLGAADGVVEPRTARNGNVIGVVFGDEHYAVPVSALGTAAAP